MKIVALFILECKTYISIFVRSKLFKNELYMFFLSKNLDKFFMKVCMCIVIYVDCSEYTGTFPAL